MDAERDGGWSLIPGGVAASGMFDSDGRHCTSEEADRVRTVLEVFPELIGRRTIPEIAEALKSHGVLEVFPPASQREEMTRTNVRWPGAAGGLEVEEC